MKILFWILVLPVVAIVVVFALFNRDAATLDLWPYPLRLEVPVYLIILGAAFVGFLLGSAVTWVSQARWRRRARERGRRIDRLEREMSRLGTGPAGGGVQPPPQEGNKGAAGAAPLLPLRTGGAGRPQERGEPG